MVSSQVKGIAVRACPWLQRAAAATTRRAPALVWLGLPIALWTAFAPVRLSRWDSYAIRTELARKEDIHNLYYAARAARWRDVPRWWTGSWIYPDVRYYRPITSMIYFAEGQLFDRNFTAYDRVTLGFHLVNTALLYFLTVSLFSHHPRARSAIGIAAVYFFATRANSMYFAIDKAMIWWPAQNDVVSLTFGLLCLVLLDSHLQRPRGWLLCLSVAAFAASVCSKEMGFIAAPMALALIVHRKRRFTPDVAAFLLATAGLWALRGIFVPNAWAPVMFRQWILVKALHHWGGPTVVLVYADVWWPLAAGAAVTTITVIGLMRRWPLPFIGAADLVAAGLSAQFVGEPGSWALLLVYGSAMLLVAVLLYVLSVALFWRYRRVEPGPLSAAAMLLAYLPILQYGGYHYFYWPGAFLALADAVFIACLWRWARDLRDAANWRVPGIEARVLLSRAEPRAAHPTRCSTRMNLEPRAADNDHDICSSDSGEADPSASPGALQ